MIHYQFSIGMFKSQFGKLKPLVPILVFKNQTKSGFDCQIYMYIYKPNPKLKHMLTKKLLSILI